MLPKRRKRPKMGCNHTPQIRCPGHLKWVRGHECAVSGPTSFCSFKIEAAHVRGGTDGAMGVKPSDCWVIPLCAMHHAEQHRVGESVFEGAYRINMKSIAERLWQSSPHGKRYRLETT